MLVGLVISLIQATTQVQEQTLTFVPKLVAVVVAIAVTGPWIMRMLINFSKELFKSFPTIVQ
jgi:flagellar biosynthetic protein FliQ